MKKKYFYQEKDGFYGAYYPCETKSRSAIIYMLGPSVDNLLVTAGVRWLHRMGCNVMAVAPEPEAAGFHEIPLERFANVIRTLQRYKNIRIGIAGGSATASLALIIASYYPQITLTFAMTPCDFVMEGYYRDHLDGVGERPGDGESIVTWKGQGLPYLPYAYRHPKYWEKLKEESKRSGNLIASRQMFDRSEKLHPFTDKEAIKVEKIQGTLILAGAEDDCLWNTCRYIRRMKERLNTRDGDCRCVTITYRHGTHFLFPQSMLTHSIPLISSGIVWIFREGRRHTKECRKNRIDLEKRVIKEIEKWKCCQSTE